MDKRSIKKYLGAYEPRRTRTMCVADFGNVEKWKHELGWNVGIPELGSLVKHFAIGRVANRRFYYGSDFGRNERSTAMTDWSRIILEKANWNNFEVVTKRVKYIHSKDNRHGFEKKCDLDVEMAVDLIRHRDAYDTIVLFSGDGDLMHAIRYLGEVYDKRCIVFGARNHIGREVFDAKRDGYVEDVLFAEDFEYRIRRRRM